MPVASELRPSSEQFVQTFSTFSKAHGDSSFLESKSTAKQCVLALKVTAFT